MRLSTRELQALRSIIGELELACDTRVDLLIQNPGQPLQPIHQIAMEQGGTTYLQRKGFVAP